MNDYLTVHQSMYVAGVSEDTGEKALKLWHLRNATSFNGEYISLLVQGLFSRFILFLCLILLLRWYLLVKVEFDSSGVIL